MKVLINGQAVIYNPRLARDSSTFLLFMSATIFLYDKFRIFCRWLRNNSIS